MEIIKLGRLKLSGTVSSPDAVENTFREISARTGAHVTWEEGRAYPNKKDPCIKLSGTPESVKSAKIMILEKMETQSNRVLLKMDVTHLEHPSLIGKGGKLIKKVMETTKCHIHFPDVNKNSSSEKSNQVSISGEPQSVERARIMIRALIPLQIFFDVSLATCNQTVLNSTSCDIKYIENPYGLFIYSVPKKDGVVSIVVRCNQGKFPSYRQNILMLMELLCGSNGVSSNLPPVNLLIDIMPHHQNFVKGQKSNNIHDIMKRTGAEIIFPDMKTTGYSSGTERNSVKITGTLDCVYMAWQEIMSFLPVCVAFDVTEMREIRGEYMDFLVDCGISVYSRPKPRFHVKSVTVKGPEKFSKQMLQYRQHLLHLPSLSFNPCVEEIDIALSFLNSLDIQPYIQKAILGQVANGTGVSCVSEKYVLQETRFLENAALYASGSGVLRTEMETNRILSNLVKFPNQEANTKSNNCKCHIEVGSNMHGLIPNTSVNSIYDDQVAQQSSLFMPKQNSKTPIGINNSSHCTYKNADSVVPEIDYYRKKFMAAKAMRRPIESEDSPQFPSSQWAGYGFSQSMPASRIRAVNESLSHYSSSLESSSSGLSDDANSLENIVFKDYLDESIWSNKKGAIFSHSNYFDFLRSTPFNIDCTAKDILPELLSQHGLYKYINIFTQEEIDYQTFLLLTDDDLQKLGIRNPAKGIIISLIRELQDIELDKVKTFDATPGAGRKLESYF